MPQKLSNIADIAKFKAANPAAIPTNAGWDMTNYEGNTGAGHANIYSTATVTNQDGTLLLVLRTDNYFSVYRAADNVFLGTVPLNAGNPVNAALNPRWTRDGKPTEIIWSANGWNECRRHPWNNPAAYQVVATAPAGKVFVDWGQEGDISDDGRYMPAQIADPYAGGVFPNPQAGVIDIANKKLLPGLVPGKPNALDISPDGKWLAFTDHLGTAASEPNKFYLIADLAKGIVKPVPLDSFVKNGNKSCGHHGWARTAAGVQVFVYMDNQDDGMKVFDPATGKSGQFMTYLDVFGHYSPAPPYGGLHFGRSAPVNGWVLMSTYDCTPRADNTWHPWANAAVFVELATGRGVFGCKLATVRNGYFTEADAACDAEFMYWGGNDDGRDNLELMRERIPALTGGTVPPVVVEPPAVDPVPALGAISWDAQVGGKPMRVTISAVPA